MALIDDLASLLRRSGGTEVAVSNCGDELRRRHRQSLQVEVLRRRVAARVAERHEARVDDHVDSASSAA